MVELYLRVSFRNINPLAMEAYFDAKCGGEDGDWADIAFEVSLYEF